MFKIILLFIYFTVNAFGFTVPADDPTRFVTDFPIYVDGDVGFIELALNGAAMLTQDQDFKNITELAIFIAVIIGGWVSFRTASMASLVKFTAIGSAGLGMMFAPSVTHIIDERSNVLIQGPNYTQVANVPYLIALPASLTSNLGSPIRDLVYTATTPITYPEVATISTHAIGPQSQIKEIFKSVAQGADLTDSSNATVTGYNAIYKAYVNQCVLGFEVEGKYNAGEILKRSKSGILASIEPSALIKNNSDTLNNLKNAGIIFEDSNTSLTCQTAWEHLNNNKPMIVNLLLPDVKKFLPPKIDLEAIMPGMVAAGYWTVSNETNGTTLMTQAQNYIFNLASQQLIADAALERAGDGVRIAQDITTAKSKALMQMEGTGGLNFFVEMLPNSLHFIYAIVLFLGVFVGVSALAQPAMALTIYKGYFLSFVSFELVKVSQVIISNMTLYYSSTGAASKLAALNGNSASVNSLSASYDYLATMTAISGTIGTMFILAIPAIIYRGDFFGFLSSAAAAPGGKYLGNNLQTATEAAALKQGGDIAMDNLRKDEVAMRRLKQLFGNDFVPNMGAAEYYNQIQSQMSRVSQNAVAMENMGTVGDQSKAVMAQAQKQISANAHLGANVTNQQATDSGIVAGAGMAGAMKGDSNLLNRADGGVSLLEQAAKTSTIEKGVSSTQHSQNIAGKFGGSDLNGYVGSGPDQNKLENLSNELNKEMKNATSAKDRFDITGSTSAKNELDKTNQILDNLKKQMIEEGSKSPLSLAQMMSNNDNLQLTGQIGGAQGYQNMMNQSGGAGAGFSKLQEAARVNSLAGMKKSVASTGEMTNKWGINLEKEVDGSLFTDDDNTVKKNLEATQAKLEQQLKTAKAGTTITSGGGVAAKTTKEKAIETRDAHVKEYQALNQPGHVTEQGRKRMTELSSLLKADSKAITDAAKDEYLHGVQRPKASPITKKHIVNDKNVARLTQDLANTKTALDGLGELENERTSTNFFKANASIAGAEQDGLAGKGMAIDKNKQVQKDIYQTNAMAGEMSQQQSMAASIATKGGVEASVRTDVANASASAAGQSAQAQALKDVFKAGGEDLIKSLKEGGEKAAEEIKKVMSGYQRDQNSTANQGMEGLKGTAEGYRHAQSVHGQHFASLTAQSGVESKAASDMAAINAMGGGQKGIHALARQAGTKSAADTAALSVDIQEAGAAGGYVARAKALAGFDSATKSADINAYKKANIMHNDGTLTDKGRDGIAIASAEKANSMVGKIEIGNNTEQFLADVQSQQYEAALKDGKTEEEAKKHASKVVEPFKDKGGRALTKADFWAKQAELKSGAFVSSNSMVLGGGATFSGSFNPDGGVSGSINSGLSSKADTTMTSSWGGVKNYDAMGDHLSTDTVELVKDGAAIMTGVAAGVAVGKYGKNMATALKNTGHKIKGEESGTDKHGNKEWAKKEEWEKMKEEGMAIKTDKGWKLNTSFEEAKAHLSKKEPSVNPSTNPTTADTTKITAPIAAPITAPSTMETPSDKIPNSSIEAGGSQGINTKESEQFRRNLALNGDKLQNAQTLRDNKIGAATTEEAVTKANAEYEATRQQLGMSHTPTGSPEMPKPTTVEGGSRFDKVISAFENAYSHAPQNKAFAAGSLAAIAALFAPSSADASTNFRMQPQAPQQTGGGFIDGIMNSASDTAGQVALGFNALTAGMGISEMFGGANSSIQKTMQGTMSNITDMFSGKQLGETLGHTAMKKLPVFGLGVGMYSAASRASDGDFAGAGMELASGALSMIPGAGTLGSAGIDLALMARDSNRQQNNEPGKGGVFDPTTTLSGMQNMANTQNQEMASQRMLGEVYNASGQINGIQNQLEKFMKSAPNISQKDVDDLKKQQAYLRSQLS